MWSYATEFDFPICKCQPRAGNSKLRVVNRTAVAAPIRKRKESYRWVSLMRNNCFISLGTIQRYDLLCFLPVAHAACAITNLNVGISQAACVLQIRNCKGFERGCVLGLHCAPRPRKLNVTFCGFSCGDGKWAILISGI